MQPVSSPVGASALSTLHEMHEAGADRSIFRGGRPHHFTPQYIGRLLRTYRDDLIAAFDHYELEKLHTF